jgi:hypothetical protein
MPLCITENAEDPGLGEIALKGNKKKENVTSQILPLT